MPKNKERFQPTDVYVGKRIRTRRMQMGMSQEKLGDELGITFQQVQKYEKGTNRVSASKLQVLANVFKVPVAFFFEGGPAEGGNGRRNASPEFTFADLLSTSDGVALCGAFEKIESKAVRRSVVTLVDRSPPISEVCAVPVFVIMYDEAQQICPVEADTADEARAIIAERLGKDVSHCPIYNADNDEDIEAILGVLRAHGAA